jgi:hypothetical protein
MTTALYVSTSEAYCLHNGKTNELHRIDTKTYHAFSANDYQASLVGLCLEIKTKDPRVYLECRARIQSRFEVRNEGNIL